MSDEKDKTIKIKSLEDAKAMVQKLRNNEAKNIDFNVKSVKRMQDEITAIIYAKDVSFQDLKKAYSLANDRLGLLKGEFRIRAKEMVPMFPETKRSKEAYLELINDTIESLEQKVKAIEIRMGKRKDEPGRTYESLFRDAKQMEKLTSYINQYVQDGCFYGIPEMETKPTVQIRLLFDVASEMNLFKENSLKDGNKDVARRLFVEKFGFTFLHRGDNSQGKNVIRSSGWKAEGKKAKLDRDELFQELKILLEK